MGWLSNALFGDEDKGKSAAFGGSKPVRNPRPKGAQKGVVRRDGQNRFFNFSEGASRTHGGRWWK